MLNFTIDKVPTDIVKEIAIKVRALRKEKKYTQQELAERANVSLASYKRFERTGQISFESLVQIAFVLGKLQDFESIFKLNEMEKIEKLFSENKSGK
jgi:transcriptional regulator with XRE-family HTH domain